jgi:predicted dehydrogenase
MKIMFVGLGSIGQRHLQNAKKIFKNANFFALRVKNSNRIIKNVRLVKKSKLKDYYKINEIYSFKDAKKIKPDLTFICNPSSFHLEEAIRFAEIGSHIFIEKPLGSNNKKIKKLKEILKKKKLLSMIGYQMRFHPAIIYLKKIIQKKKYGKVNSANFYNLTYLPNHHPYENYRTSYASKKKLGGGVVQSLIHEIDIISYFFGNPYKIYKNSSNSNIINTETVNNFSALAIYKKKHFCFDLFIKLSFCDIRELRGFTIQFDKKFLEMDLKKNILKFFSHKNKKIITKKFYIKRNELFEMEIKHLKKCIEKKIEPSTSVFKNDITNKIFEKCI